MSQWFDEQLRKRMQDDQEGFDRAFSDLSSVIMGERIRECFLNDRQRTQNAIDEILRYYGIPLTVVPEGVTGAEEYLQTALQPTGVMRRRVSLRGKWYRDAIGPMLGSLDDGTVIALLPRTFSGYAYRDPETGALRRVDAKTAARIDADAYCFYKPFPQSKLKLKDLLKYMLSALTPGDVVLFLGISALVTVFGLFSPFVNQLMFDHIIPSGNTGYLLPTLVLLLSFTVSMEMLNASKRFISDRFSTRINLAVEPAAMARLLMLPASFFKQYNSGELSSRLASLTQLCSSIADAFSGTVLSAILSLVYLLQIGTIAGALVLPALLTVLALALLNVVTAFANLKYSRRSIELDAKMSGLVFALFSGISKLKLTGSEKRGFAKWASLYKEQAELSYDPPLLVKYGGVINTLISSVSLLVVFYVSVTNRVSTGDYMAYTVSYGMISAALLSLAGLTTVFTDIKPQLDMVRPILDTTPETSVDKAIVEKVSGSIELSNVSFRYTPDGPDILHNLSLRIKPHEYVAIVGRTGCGKSTLMRLLLGFEQPTKGAVYYDGADLTKIDLRSLRRKIGVVTQDGNLFPGDIYANISISAPMLTLDEAWEVARLSGLDEDIKDMPMGMNTLISEGSSGLSGGQRQRLMIARALAPKPRVLMFDEATSALDNITQKRVADSLAQLKCTRIVIAHRLSTIRECDRILALDHGEIIESGTFDELLAKKGFFYELAKRQLLDSQSDVAPDSIY